MKSQPVGKLLTVFVAGALTCLVFIHYFGAAYTVNGDYIKILIKTWG
jgi:dolichol kinase